MAKRQRNRDTAPEGLLGDVIAAIEQDDPDRYTRVLERLLSDGPLRCDVAVATWAPIVRAELLAFLRDVVRRGAFGRDALYGIGTYRPLNFSAGVDDDGRVTCSVNGDGRDLIVVQLITLLQLVGLRNVRVCAAPDCNRMFVRRYRRDYCSRAHQEKQNKRNQRQNDKLKRERARLARQRRKREV